MIKKISTILLGGVIISLCGLLLVPQDKAEADQVNHYIVHRYGHEWGQTTIAGVYKTFWTDYRGNANVSMGWIKPGTYRAVAIMRCGGYHYKSVPVPSNKSITVPFYPPHRY